MAREYDQINFRAWDKLHGMRTCGEFPLYYEVDNGFHSGKYDDKSDWYDLPLMQSTGLHDRNGKEIYEDDIVDTEYSRNHEQRHAFQVEWCNEIGAWVFTPFEVGNMDAPLLGIEEFSQRWDEGIQGGVPTIIGNIHENQELLTK